MRRLILAAFLTLPLAAHAQQAPQAITLTPDEYSKLTMDIAARDPALSMLIQKQQQAQAAAAEKAVAAAKAAPPAPSAAIPPKAPEAGTKP